MIAYKQFSLAGIFTDFHSGVNFVLTGYAGCHIENVQPINKKDTHCSEKELHFNTQNGRSVRCIQSAAQGSGSVCARLFASEILEMMKMRTL